MSVDLLGTVRLLHRVFGFLAQQSSEQLTGLASGKIQLTFAPAQAGPPPNLSSPPRLSSPPEEPAKPAVPPVADVDYAEIAAELRKQDSVDAGSAYLDGLQLRGKKATKADFLGVAQAMELTLAKSVTVPLAKRRLVEHAIGARKKYAGLESW